MLSRCGVGLCGGGEELREDFGPLRRDDRCALSSHSPSESALVALFPVEVRSGARSLARSLGEESPLDKAQLSAWTVLLGWKEQQVDWCCGACRLRRVRGPVR